MAKDDDTDRMVSAGSTQDCLPTVGATAGCTSVRTIDRRLSEDGRYLIITEERVFDLYAIQQLTRGDEHHQHAQMLCSRLNRYLDRKKQETLCEHLTTMLCSRRLEWHCDAQGRSYFDIVGNTTQAEMMHELLNHMTRQKLQSLQHESKAFNELKNLLMDLLQYQGEPLKINSISVTLKRALKEL